jgi:hypothetical protein
MSRELLQQALDALKDWDGLIKFQYTGSSEAMSAMQYAAWDAVDVIAAIEKELAKPEPTQEQIYEIIIRWDSSGKRSRRELARRIETLFTEPRVHVTDGTLCWCDPIDELAKPEQEPVAWTKTYDQVCSLLRLAHDTLACTSLPFPKEWVGLTQDEIDAIGYKYGAGGLDLMNELLEKLKEKNHAA